MQVPFSVHGQDTLRRLGIALPFTHPVHMPAEFAVETPVVVQGSIHTDLPFRMGAFSANYGGRLRNVAIGRYCSISGDFQSGWDDHPTDWVTSSMVGYVPDLHGWATLLGHADHRLVHQFASMRGPTTIGNDVWIGHGVFVRAGVTIGDGAVIGSRSLVLHDVPPYTIVAGSPARVVRQRFDDATVERLQRLAWWRYSFFDLPTDLVHSPASFLDALEDRLAAGGQQPYEPGWSTRAELLQLLTAQAA
jgi:acetyltransferase-like isoleucine patch superfamily enzyme